MELKLGVIMVRKVLKMLIMIFCIVIIRRCII